VSARIPVSSPSGCSFVEAGRQTGPRWFGLSGEGADQIDDWICPRDCSTHSNVIKHIDFDEFRCLPRTRIFRNRQRVRAGSARILAGLGFRRQEALDHAGAIVAATDLPVSADLEKGSTTHRKARRRRIGPGLKAAETRKRSASARKAWETRRRPSLKSDTGLAGRARLGRRVLFDREGIDLGRSGGAHDRGGWRDPCGLGAVRLYRMPISYLPGSSRFLGWQRLWERETGGGPTAEPGKV
jgi:hypothetical protein